MHMLHVTTSFTSFTGSKVGLRVLGGITFDPVKNMDEVVR